MNKLLSLLILITVFFTSCSKDLPDVGGTTAQSVSNEWWCTLTYNGNDIYKLGHFKISTYNTAANADSIWVDDLKNGWGFKAKAKADYTALTFASSPTAANAYYDPAKPTSFPLTVKITEGKVLPGLGKSKTGNTADSIYFKVEFSDDPGTTYVMSGHSRTRFEEDEY